MASLTKDIEFTPQRMHFSGEKNPSQMLLHHLNSKFTHQNLQVNLQIKIFNSKIRQGKKEHIKQLKRSTNQTRNTSIHCKQRRGKRKKIKDEDETCEMGM